MTQQEVAQFADKTAMINERTQITYTTNEIDVGYFYNNKYSTTRQDNLWNFIVMKDNGEENVSKIINGNDLESIKIIRLY